MLCFGEKTIFLFAFFKYRLQKTNYLYEIWYPEIYVTWVNHNFLYIFIKHLEGAPYAVIICFKFFLTSLNSKKPNSQTLFK